MPLLSVQDLKVRFDTRNGVVHAVNGISFDLEKGETVGIVGESGSGKSVSCYALMNLIPQPPGRIESGRAYFDGKDLLKMSDEEIRKIRGKRVSMIFQDPMTSLNPYMRIEKQLMEPLEIHEGLSQDAAARRALEALDEVGVPDARNRIRSFPHEFSGGMRQRVMIAMALITRPELLIADEPTTALDVTVQAQIMDLIRKLQAERGMSVILITHDLGVVAGFCDRVNVMYAGQIVEKGTADQVFYESLHAYTIGLKESIPGNQTKGARLKTIPGSPPDMTLPPVGCAFAPRSSLEFTQEQAVHPGVFKEVSDGHWVEVHPATVKNYEDYI